MGATANDGRLTERNGDAASALRASRWLGSSVLQPGMTIIPGCACTDRNR